MDTNAECSVSKTLQQIQKDLLVKMEFMGCKSKKNCAAEHHFKAWHCYYKKKQEMVWIWIFERHFKFNLIIRG